jgi:hypothetical protein
MFAYCELFVKGDVVWSKNSCSLVRVVFQEPAKPLTTLNRAFTLAVLADRRKEQDIALALMIPLVMIMPASIMVSAIPVASVRCQSTSVLGEKGI